MIQFSPVPTSSPPTTSFGRVEAAKLLTVDSVPVKRLLQLIKKEVRAFMLLVRRVTLGRLALLVAMGPQTISLFFGEPVARDTRHDAGRWSLFRNGLAALSL